MYFEFKYIPFFRRIFLSIILFLIFLCFIELVVLSNLKINFHYKFGIYLLLIIYFYFDLVKRKKNYITSILLKEELLLIEYNIYNKKKLKKIKLNEIDILYGGEMNIYTTQIKLIFKEKGRKFLIQYQIGDWNKTKMKEVYNAFQNETR